jgi:hypothetical protein
MLLALLRNSSIGIDKERGVSLIKISLHKQKSKTKTGRVLSLINMRDLLVLALVMDKRCLFPHKVPCISVRVFNPYRIEAYLGQKPAS